MLLPLLWPDIFTHFVVTLVVPLILFMCGKLENHLRVLIPYLLADVIAYVIGGSHYDRWQMLIANCGCWNSHIVWWQFLHCGRWNSHIG